LRPDRHPPTVAGPYPKPARFESHVPETVLERVYQPFLSRAYKKILPVRRLQLGRLHLYILYTFVTLVVLIVVSLP
jgi:hydrogenase-4 component B